ncbi:hypothetical protein F2Q69_00059389 [Brassica cretica]|uniref:Uncharacterized protein n=1 Tax=Brassica cretica TaxID=69181 RepID=A0A8S9RAL9_BRACR|nr:hypothetical protein F2Q69_00059389 [Brassica cretica]
MSGNTKDIIAVHKNAGKTTPAATAPMVNAYANATILEKIENLAATFRHRKCNETSSRFLFLNINGNDKSYQTPLIAEKGSTANRVHNLPLYFFRLSCGKTLGLSWNKGNTANLDKERDGAKSENQNSPIRLAPRSHHPSSRASICRQNLITWRIFLIILGTSGSSLAPLDHPWLFLNSKKVFDEMLIHFRKSNDTKIETWITKTANIDSSLNTARKAEKSRKNLYSCYLKWADRHEKSMGK